MIETKGIVFKFVVFFQTFGSILTLVVELADFGAVLLDPPGRGSLWRHNISGAPVNPRDHQLNCGGAQNQWRNNNGKCGLCGDPWNGPRDHEIGGKFFTNHISSSYPRNSVINLTVKMLSNSIGWMEFRIHPYTKNIEQNHLDRYLLKLGGNQTTRYRVRKSGYHVIPVLLPEYLECERCVLQWKYHTGTLWGCTDDTQTDCCYGCGQEQEEYYNCADISVKPETGINNQQDTKLKFKSLTVTPSSDYLRWWCLTQCEGEECREPPCSTISRQRRSTSNCLAAGAWRGQANMDTWCRNNCQIGYCPASHCQCQDVSPVTTSTTSTTTTQFTTTTSTEDLLTTHAHSSTTTTSQNGDAPGIVRVLVSRGCEYCKDRNDSNCEDLYCPGYNAANIVNKGTLTQKITELSDYFCTTCDIADSICQKLFCSREKLMVSLGLHTKCRICELTGNCLNYPECDQINGKGTTTTSTVTTQPTTTVNTVPMKRTCVAINYYAQIIGMDQWCEDNCGTTADINCYPEVCQCSDPSMPLVQKLDTGDVTTCKAIGQVANIPGMDKWCTDNCPTNCPETYCSCSVQPVTQAPTTTKTTTTTTTTTTASPTMTSYRTTTKADDPTESTATFTTPSQTTPSYRGADYYSINAMNGIMCNICRSDLDLYRGCSDQFCSRFDNSVGDPVDKVDRALNYSPELFCGIQNKDSVFCEPAPIIRPFILSSMCSSCIYLSPDQNCNMYCSSS
ncbi:mucin-5AC-like [Saccostrea cucullata]|uniref:mucin-5AC-like n=1 Tax=Saccostrea cuccullata TaxID=36930 RepID=UPI002ED6117B